MVWTPWDDDEDEEDVGCSAHHYGEWEPCGAIEVHLKEIPGEGVKSIRLRQAHKRVCQHQFCLETEETNLIVEKISLKSPITKSSEELVDVIRGAIEDEYGSVEGDDDE